MSIHEHKTRTKILSIDSVQSKIKSNEESSAQPVNQWRLDKQIYTTHSLMDLAHMQLILLNIVHFTLGVLMLFEVIYSESFRPSVETQPLSL